MYVYNSRDIEYKSMFGAVKEGTPIKFRISVPRSECCRGAYLMFREDSRNSETRNGMFWAGMCGDDREWWDITFTPEHEGLYWYRFELETDCGSKSINRTHGGTGEIGGRVNPWQLTVYEKDYEVPDWFRGGIMYQIFPDRFASSGEEKKDIPYGRVLRDDWGAQPYFRPNEEGKILNNDYFGGDLKGIIEKLDYLKSLGVSCIYLNPVFEAHSNHRYDTADYTKIDPLLGTNDDMKELCRKAKEYGMAVILDGVFSHTGDDSIYFNKYGRYDSKGAYNSQESPYYDWYTFKHWKDDYESWWGITILPEIKEDNPNYIDYICGKNGILRRWIKCGISGWRLDVADELPDVFLDQLRKAVKEEDSDAIIIGEVWEDATNKISHGGRRRFLRGSQLDSVMNYPFRDAILNFVRTGNAEYFGEAVMNVMENYPRRTIDVLMNHVGTHDTERLITCLAGEEINGRDREWQATQRLSDEQRKLGEQLVKLAAVIQYFLPGVPSVYYGDEIGMEGYRDPFNRVCYPWGKDYGSGLLEFYRRLGKIRNGCKCLSDGEFILHRADGGMIVFERRGGGERLLCAVNRNMFESKYKLPDDWKAAESLIGAAVSDGVLDMKPLSASVLKITDDETV